MSLYLLRGESSAALSRELGVEICRLEQWRDKALAGIDTALKVRVGDPLQAELNMVGDGFWRYSAFFPRGKRRRAQVRFEARNALLYPRPKYPPG